LLAMLPVPMMPMHSFFMDFSDAVSKGDQ